MTLDEILPILSRNNERPDKIEDGWAIWDNLYATIRVRMDGEVLDVRMSAGGREWMLDTADIRTVEDAVDALVEAIEDAYYLGKQKDIPDIQDW